MFANENGGLVYVRSAFWRFNDTGAESVGLVYPPSREDDFKFEEYEDVLRTYCAAAPVEIRQGFAGKVMRRSLHYDPLPDFDADEDPDSAFVKFMKEQESRLRAFAKGIIGEDDRLSKDD